jgi:hypothetical protein
LTIVCLQQWVDTYLSKVTIEAMRIRGTFSLSKGDHSYALYHFQTIQSEYIKAAASNRGMLVYHN